MSPGRRRRRRWRRRVRRAGLLVVLVAGVCLAAATGAAAWSDLAHARGQLAEAREVLAAVAADPAGLRTAEGRSAALASGRRAMELIAGAGRRLERSVPLRAAGFVPGLSTQRWGVLAVAEDAGDAAGAAVRLVAAVDELAARERVHEGAIPLDGLARLEAEVGRAGRELADATRSAGGLWGPLADARRELNRAAGTTGARLQEAAAGMGAARRFLGADGPRRYLVALQNNAEMRDQGMVLSYAFLRADAGRLAVDRSGSIADLVLDRPVPVPVPEGTQRIFGALAPTRLWQSVNATADFAWSGRVMAEMARQATGQPVDGVIAVDVPGLAALLRVLGPVAVPGVPVPVDAGNAADVLLNRLYADFPGIREQGERRERLGAVAEALVTRLAAGSFDAVHLGTELATASASGHLRLWSADAAEEAVLERSGMGGGPGARSPERTIHVAVQNATSAKLDYFVKPELDLRVSLTPSGDAVVDADVVVVNEAPADAPASYQFGPHGPAQSRPGEYVSRVYFWGPRGARQPDSVAESGLRLNQGPVTVPPGGRASVRFQTVIPRAVRDGRLDLRLVPQPRVAPMRLRVALAAPGWQVQEPSALEQAWDRTLALSWRAKRAG